MASAARPWPEQVGGIAEPAETGLEPSGRSGQHSTAGIAPACAGGSTPAPHRRASTRADTLSASADDLAQGQIVVVVARWILVLAGLVLALWNPAPIGELRAQVAAVLLLAVANFYLHAQLLRRRPVIDAVAYAASAADLAVITFLVVLQGGF